jgi:LAO/AO transport system kinase
MQALAEWRRAEGHWARRRAAQATHWFEEEVRSGLLAQLTDNARARTRMKALSVEVAAGESSPDAAAAQMLRYLRGESLDTPPKAP